MTERPHPLSHSYQTPHPIDVGRVVESELNLLHPPDPGGGHDGGVAALLLQDPLQPLAVQTLDTEGHLHTCVSNHSDSQGYACEYM